MIDPEQPHPLADDVADAIVTRRAVDWDRVDASSSPEDRPVLHELKILDEIARLHRALAETLPDSPAFFRGDAASNTTWGPLRLLAKVADGAGGTVYRAWDTRLDREVALKLIRSVGIESTARVLQEGRRLARVKHPNVATVYGAEEYDRRAGLWMEFVDGRTIETLIQDRGPLPVEEAVQVAITLCRALQAVHEAGLLHRDLNTHNVMREASGRIVLMDFHAGLERQLSRTELIGTPLYLAPEVLLSEQPASVQSDVYSAAVIAFRLLTAAFPVDADSLETLRDRHRGRSRLAIASFRPDVPAPLTALIDCALSPEPRGRPQTASEFATLLAECLPGSRRTGRAPRWWWPGIALFAASCALAIVPRGAAVQREIAETRLTASSVERPVRSSRISPDGRLLAYADSDGIHILSIENGETRLMPDTTGLNVYAWTSDSSRLRVRRCEHPVCRGWDLPVLGGPRLLNGAAWPDYQWVKASANGDRLLREVEPNAFSADTLDGTAPKLAFRGTSGQVQGASWSADVSRILYIPAGSSRVESVPAKGGTALTVFDAVEGQTVDDVLELSDHHLVLVMRRAALAKRSRTAFSVQEVPTDAQGVATGSPRLLVGWRDEWLHDLSASADGKRLAFSSGTSDVGSHVVYVAGFDPRVGLTSAPRRITSEGWDEFGTSWAPDSRELYVTSSHNDDGDIIKRRLDAFDSTPLAVGSGEQFRPEPTSDGRWLFYVDRDHPEAAGTRIMRMPLPGGHAEVVANLEGTALPRCSFRGRCVVEEIQRGIVLSELDPVQGKGRELGRWPEGWQGLCLLPDGQSVAFIRNPPHNNSIRIVSLVGGPARDIEVHNVNDLYDLDPLPDGSGFFSIADGESFYSTAENTGGHGRLVLVGIDGTAKTLWSDPTLALGFAVSSPDGKHVAITAASTRNDVWLAER